MMVIRCQCYRKMRLLSIKRLGLSLARSLLEVELTPGAHDDARGATLRIGDAARAKSLHKCYSLCVCVCVCVVYVCVLSLTTMTTLNLNQVCVFPGELFNFPQQWFLCYADFARSH